MKAALLDAGPIVAYLRGGDVYHRGVVAGINDRLASGTALATTWEAVSEAFTLVRSRVRSGARNGHAFQVLDWAWESNVIVAPSAHADHIRCRQILDVHRDVALSYADALLLAIGERMEVDEILTLDGTHFPAVRLASRTAVTVLR